MGTFSEANVLNKLKHYLPAQAPLKDFVHHNTLHAFQHLPFGKAIRIASKIFGYKVSLNIEEYRSLFDQERINVEILNKTICKKYGELSLDTWIEKLIYKAYDSSISQKIGLLRANWKKQYHLDLDTIVHTNLFRILNSYLDQGVAIRKFPTDGNGLLHSIRDIEKRTFISFFKTQRARDLIFTPGISISDLLKIVVGDERFYEQYLFDQQFAHPGWSGLVSVIESQPLSLFESRKITLNELIILELVLEIDNLDHVLGNRWKPISEMPEVRPLDLFEESKFTELDEVLSLWQEAFEWTYYDEVLAGITINTPNNTQLHQTSFQAFFCIDDRECSIRRNIELLDNTCQTFGTPGHFAVDAYYQPKNAKFYTKICPAPITPIHLLKEVTTTRKTEEEIHLSNSDSSLFKGWLISQTIGFWSAIKLLLNIFKPSMSPATSSSFSHMYEQSDLTVKNRSTKHVQDGLQIGYTVNEMVDRVESVLKSTGLIDSFASLVYIIGHGASSTNNTHYAGYDCGACSGRPGSANARAFCYMANHHEVRRRLGERGIKIPEDTEFLGGLHDTTRDEFTFYDEELLSPDNQSLHLDKKSLFNKALKINAKERSRRFASIDSRKSEEKIYKEVQKRSVSLFEPRPELNHATNALCIIGNKELNHHLFLDRRSFLNSYNYKIDPKGQFLAGILNAAAPVCGGINLEYYFSRVDNQRFGAGSKLPHNVMGLIGVANGFEGDLRTGLPLQMVEVHDPIRLLMIIEHFPEVVLKTIKDNPSTYEWFENEWVVLCVIHPIERTIHHFVKGEFSSYLPITTSIRKVDSLTDVFESQEENLPIYHIV